MLSTQYRLRLEFICKCIANGEEVKLDDMIWADKLGKANRSASEMLRKARRKANNPDMQPGSLDEFMNQMDLGDPDLRITSSTASTPSRRSLPGSSKTRLTTGVNGTNRLAGKDTSIIAVLMIRRRCQSLSCSSFFCCGIARPILEMKFDRRCDLRNLVRSQLKTSRVPVILPSVRPDRTGLDPSSGVELSVITSVDMDKAFVASIAQAAGPAPGQPLIKDCAGLTYWVDIESHPLGVIRTRMPPTRVLIGSGR